MTRKILFFCLFILIISGPSSASEISKHSTPVRNDSIKIDSILKTFTLEQKIAQIMIIRAFSDRDSVYNDSLTALISRYNPGGICFFKGSPFRQATLINRWQQITKTPLLITMDAEWGLGMRLDSAFSFPRQMTMGAIRDDSLIYSVSSAIASDCKRLGIHVNFAPDIDINNNPENPVIGFRSFGENKYDVARKGLLYMKGLQDHGIVSVAKHFPGHGDTDTDSHLSLPVLKQSAERLDSVELFPFREMIRNKVDGIMVAHLFIPALDTTTNAASTLSAKVIRGLLKDKMGFKGFVISDALDMKGVAKYYKPGDIEVKALLAGNDILLLPQNAGLAIDSIKMACKRGILDSTEIEQKCKAMLELKYRKDVMSQTPVLTRNLYSDLHPLSSTLLSRKIYQEALTLVKNRDYLIPINFLDRRKIAVLSVGDTLTTIFQESILKYTPAKTFSISYKIPKEKVDSLISKLSGFDLIIAGFHNISSFAKNYGISDGSIALIDSLAQIHKVVLDLFGTPYSLSMLKNPSIFEGIIVSYQDNPVTEAASAGGLFGGIALEGHLPVTGSSSFALNTGIRTEKTRLEYVLPEEIGIASAKLGEIDSIVQEGIRSRAYPGCQILFAKDGKIFYQKSFGHPRYEDTMAVRNDDIYDLASLTKVMATTLAIMKLSEEGKISTDQPLGKYLPELKGTNKENLLIRDIMTHQAGLQAWIPFYQKTLKDNMPDPAIYSDHYSDEFPFRVAEQLYIRHDYPDTVFAAILASPLRSTRDYKYSDLGFYLLKKAVEKITEIPFEEYLDREFYRPMGLSTICFNPRKHFPIDRIMPTAYDNTFRKQLLRGDVHDPGSAMIGGISGHAGLFSDAGDLAVILQMLLNQGEYGGKQYLMPSTIKKFTHVQFPENGNRRGLGFDKPLLNFSPDSPACESASKNSFGHSGFTGTYFWADPDNNLIYIFLSNRVYPDEENTRLSGMNIRTRIHQAMYDLLKTNEGSK
ncbi:MAG: glycoside hydrolase family 3 N-terminal domain-containing protein [Bacteroidota bacterium]|nr:glycoside hydrolase family 3 N-terminal domain-containing protein [Bacteroidota bacterium]